MVNDGAPLDEIFYATLMTSMIGSLALIDVPYSPNFPLVTLSLLLSLTTPFASASLPLAC